MKLNPTGFLIIIEEDKSNPKNGIVLAVGPDVKKQKVSDVIPFKREYIQGTIINGGVVLYYIDCRTLQEARR